MESDDRKEVLLELSQYFIEDYEDYRAIEHCLEEDGDIFTAECEILLAIDNCYNLGLVNEAVAKVAYEKLNLCPIISSRVRQVKFSEQLFLFNSTQLPVKPH